MASNGLSNRRVVLKRPKVCKSKDPLCGNCALVASAIPVDGPPGFPFQLEIDLDCDPNPAVQQYQIYVAGGPTMDNPPQFINVNVTAFVACHAPLTPGQYLIAVIVLSNINCSHIFELPLFVNGP